MVLLDRASIVIKGRKMNIRLCSILCAAILVGCASGPQNSPNGAPWFDWVKHMEKRLPKGTICAYPTSGAQTYRVCAAGDDTKPKFAICESHGSIPLQVATQNCATKVGWFMNGSIREGGFFFTPCTFFNQEKRSGTDLLRLSCKLNYSTASHSIKDRTYFISELFNTGKTRAFVVAETAAEVDELFGLFKTVNAEVNQNLDEARLDGFLPRTYGFVVNIPSLYCDQIAPTKPSLGSNGETVCFGKFARHYIGVGWMEPSAEARLKVIGRVFRDLLRSSGVNVAEKFTCGKGRPYVRDVDGLKGTFFDCVVNPQQEDGVKAPLYASFFTFAPRPHQPGILNFVAFSSEPEFAEKNRGSLIPFVSDFIDSQKLISIEP